MLKIVILGYSNCDKIPVCRVQNLGNTAFFWGETSGVFGETNEWLGKHAPNFGETFALVLASYSAFGTGRICINYKGQASVLQILTLCIANFQHVSIIPQLLPAPRPIGADYERITELV